MPQSKPQAARKERIVTILMTELEYARVARAAANASLPVGTYIRTTILAAQETANAYPVTSQRPVGDS